VEMRRVAVALAVVVVALVASGWGSGGSPSRVYVPVLLPSGSFLRYQPTKMVVAGDGAEILARIRYVGYGGAEANATGTLLVDDCIASCAAGTFHPVRATLVFHGFVICRGLKVYTRLAITAPGAVRFQHVRRQNIALDYLAARCEPSQR
jgi:hypothetical protein